MTDPTRELLPVPETIDGRTTSEALLYEIRRVIVGQDAMLERVLVAVLAGGHLLLEGVPGLAKTLTIKTLADVLDSSFRRIQFTPDLVPADLVGTRIYRPDRGTFDTELGPVFCNFLLADEINRAPAKVQSALLEVMQERQVTIGPESYPVPRPFLVMATQNPIESEGTYPLPEAQIDRFMMKVVVGYPSAGEEAVVVERSLRPAAEVRPILTAAGLAELQRLTADVYVDRTIVDYAVALTAATRTPDEVGLPKVKEFIAFGASPRGSINLVHAARALAVARGRRYVLPSDVEELARDVLRHRIVPSFTALAEEVTADMILDRLIPAVPAPAGEPRGAVGMTGPRSPLRRGRSPDPGPARRPESLLRSLDVTVGRRIHGLLSGEFRAHDRGGGTELAQVRPYEPGDDVRTIDWNVTARMTVPHVRVHVPERALTSWLALDVSPSMTFGTADRRKADVAEGVALALGHVATQRGNRLGTITFGGRSDRRMPPTAAGAACSPRCSPLATTSSPATASRSGPARRHRRCGSSPASLPAAAWSCSCPTSAGRRRLADRPRGRRRPVAGARRRDPRPARGRAARRRRPDPHRHRNRPRGPGRHLVASPSRTLRPCRRGRPGCPGARPSPAGRRPRRPVDVGQLAPVARLPAPPPEDRVMTFASPELLVGAPPRSARVAAYLFVQRRRARYAVAFTNVDLLANLVPRTPAWRRHVPPALYLGAIGALVFALARPSMIMAVPRRRRRSS